MTGQWLSEKCEHTQGTNLYRDITLDGTHDGYIDLFNDADCTMPSITWHNEGPYTVGKASTTVEGAYEVDFVFSKVTFIPRDQGMVDYLNTAAPGTCGNETWQLEVPQDVTSTGCALMNLDLESCGTQYQIIKIEGDKLYLGAYPEDGSGVCTKEKRPTTWDNPVVKKK